MKNFLSFISEELTNEQKRVVKSYGSNKAAVKISKHVIPKGQDRLVIPLKMVGKPASIDPPHMLAKHLDEHGYDVEDYAQGLAKNRKNGMSIKIGKVLNKTDPSGALLQKFNNDPSRDAVNHHSSTEVVISRHPHDVAGMSTDRGWTSCMNMDGGSNAHYLKHDIKCGTHVAYLVNKGDHEIKNPIARISLKPFQSEDGKHTILGAESSSYGTHDNAFEQTVHEWTNDNFTPRDGLSYTKVKHVYNDDGEHDLRGNVYGGIEKINQLSEKPNRSDEDHKEYISKLSDVEFGGERALVALATKGTLQSKKDFIDNTNFDNSIITTIEHSPSSHKNDLIDHLYEKKSHVAERAAARFGNEKHLQRLIDKHGLDYLLDPKSTTQRAFIGNYNIPKQYHEQILKQSHLHNFRSAHLATSEQMHDIIDRVIANPSLDENNGLAYFAVPHMTHEHLMKISKSPLMKTVLLTSETIRKGGPKIIDNIMNNPHVADEMRRGLWNHDIIERGNEDQHLRILKDFKPKYGYEQFEKIWAKSARRPKVRQHMMDNVLDYHPDLRGRIIGVMDEDSTRSLIHKAANEGSSHSLSDIISNSPHTPKLYKEMAHAMEALYKAHGIKPGYSASLLVPHAKTFDEAQHFHELSGKSTVAYKLVLRSDFTRNFHKLSDDTKYDLMNIMPSKSAVWEHDYEKLHQKLAKNYLNDDAYRNQYLVKMKYIPDADLSIKTLYNHRNHPHANEIVKNLPDPISVKGHNTLLKWWDQLGSDEQRQNMALRLVHFNSGVKKLLESPNHHIRKKAFSEYADYNKDDLLKSMNDPKASIRALAGRNYINHSYGVDNPSEIMDKLFNDPDHRVALEAIKKLNNRKIPIDHIVNNASDHVKAAHLVYTLSHSEASHDSAVKFLDHPNAYIRKAAISHLLNHTSAPSDDLIHKMARAAPDDITKDIVSNYQDHNKRLNLKHHVMDLPEFSTEFGHDE